MLSLDYISQFSLHIHPPYHGNPLAYALGLSCLKQSPSTTIATSLFPDTIPQPLALLAAPPGRLIDSVPGAGDHATFLIWLPLLQIKATSLHPSTPPAPQALSIYVASFNVSFIFATFLAVKSEQLILYGSEKHVCFYIPVLHLFFFLSM